MEIFRISSITMCRSEDKHSTNAASSPPANQMKNIRRINFWPHFKNYFSIIDLFLPIPPGTLAIKTCGSLRISSRNGTIRSGSIETLAWCPISRIIPRIPYIEGKFQLIDSYKAKNISFDENLPCRILWLKIPMYCRSAIFAFQ